MDFKPDHKIPSQEVLNLRNLPIEDASSEVREKFKEKQWKTIPIEEAITPEPKSLEVVSNTPFPGRAMGWPAYYKTVAEGLEGDGKDKGFGELAQAIAEALQTSPIVKVRAEVKSRLDQAQKMLDNDPSTANLKLVLVDGYRRMDVQRRLFDSYHNYVIAKNPGLTIDESKDMARKMVSEPPADMETLAKSPAPHTTGGSIDIVLVFKDKINIKSDYWLNDAMVPLGAKFDEMMHPVYRDERSETVFYEKKIKEGAKLEPEEQQGLEYRRILFHILTKAGFTNYFNEFWHFDYGNQFDASAAGKPKAQFGFAGGVKDGQIVEDLTAEEEAFKSYQAIHGPEEADRVKHHFGLQKND